MAPAWPYLTQWLFPIGPLGTKPEKYDSKYDSSLIVLTPIYLFQGNISLISSPYRNTDNTKLTYV